MLVTVMVAMLFAGTVNAAEEKKADAPAAELENLAPNPGAENTHHYSKYRVLVKHDWNKNRKGQVPVGWGLYVGGGRWFFGVSTDEKKSGKNSAFLKIVRVDHSDKRNVDWAQAAVFFSGECDLYTVGKSIKIKPGANYCFSFWVKGTITNLRAMVQGFIPLPEGAKKKLKRVTIKSFKIFDEAGKEVPRITATDQWKFYTVKVKMPAGCEQFSCGIGNTSGYRTGENDKVGNVLYIDDVRIWEDK